MMATIVLLISAPAHAQFGDAIVKVNIPFNFNIATQKFAAGEYTLKPLLQNTMLLRDERGQILTSVASISIESREAPDSSKLVFNQYHGQYFLAQIWELGNTVGRELVKSPVELETAKASDSPTQQIAVNFFPRR
jgi:hypothetical protein